VTHPVTLAYEHDQAILTLHRPPANLIDQTVCEAMERHAKTLAHAAPASGVVILAEGDVFSGGLDTASFDSHDADQSKALYVGLNRMLSAVYSIGAPVVAALQGHALGVGFVLSLCADYRIAGPDAELGLEGSLAGLPFSAVAAEILRAELSPENLRRVGLGGKTAKDQVALEWGLVDEITQTDLGARARTVAADRANHPGFASLKRQFRREAIDKTHALAEQDTDPVTAALGILLMD